MRGVLLTLVLLGAACASGAPTAKGARHDHRGVNVTLFEAKNAKRPPLVVFLEEEGTKSHGAAVGAALDRRGVAVAALTYRRGLAPSALAPVLEDLASRSDRIVLIGDGDSADMAAGLALAPSPKTPIAGVIALRGGYASLAPNAKAPPFLLLAAAKDDAARAQAGRRFARALEAAGAKDVESYLVPEHDADALLDWAPDDALSALVVSFVKQGTEPRSIDGPFGAKQVWGRSPPLAYDALWNEKGIVERPIDPTFRAALDDLFGEASFELAPWPLRTYRAVPLEAYLAARSDIGAGEHLVVTNVRGERLYLTRKDLSEHQPLLVLGVDDETNLHRLFVRYRVNLAYSWKTSEGAMPLMLRSVGPFLFFPKGPPPHLRDTTLATFSLHAGSFHLQAEDPLASVRKLAPELRSTLTGNDGCLKCHALRGTGARAHHVRANDGNPHGAFALAFEEYPPEVLRRFLFEQDTVAASFGVAPLHVAEPTARALLRITGREP